MYDLGNFILFSGSILFSFVQVSSQGSGYCIDHGYTPENGSRTPAAVPGYEYFSGSKIRYHCNENYKLDPYEPVQGCLSNSNGSLAWSPEHPPRCVELIICEKPNIPHATFDKDVYYENDRMVVTCDEGYSLVNPFPSPVCTETGEWSYVPTCESSCPVPQPIEHGFYYFFPPPNEEMTSLPPETIVFYTCDDGYKIPPNTQQHRECRHGAWTGTAPTCERTGCDPPNLPLGDYIPVKDHYDVHDTITYVCEPDDGRTKTCLANHTWSGTHCSAFLTTTPMPYTHGNIYCAKPIKPVLHGNYKCCNDIEVSLFDVDPPLDFCCPVRGLLQFQCDSGYSLKGEPDHWLCGTNGQWFDIDTSDALTMTTPPTCFVNETSRPTPGPLTDEMLKPVIGVAAGVLLILSLGIIIAVCRPKLIDMKRRWREIREDEDELIIDGRRIVLPSYEEAMTSRDSYMQLTNENEPSTSSNLRDTLTPAPRPERTSQNSDSQRENIRHSCSSDEEMLIPETMGHNDNTGSRPQSLVLKAGTSVDACVVINQPPEPSTSNFAITDKTQMKVSNQLTEIPARNFSVESSDDPMLSLGTECNLDFLYPQSLQPQIRPLILEHASNDVLSYPIIPVENGSQSNEDQQQSFTIHIDPESIIQGNDEYRKEELIQGEEVREEDVKTKDYSEHENDDPPLQVTNSDYIHIVMSSQMPKRQKNQDEMGSTSV